MANALTVHDAARNLIDALSTDLLLPPTISYDKLKATFITAVANNPDILSCDKSSIKTALMKSCADNLLPDNREAALVPFNTSFKIQEPGKPDRWEKRKLIQYMPMIYGVRKRALELGGVRISAEVVHENDFYESEQGDHPFIKHKRAAMGKPRGPIVGAYAIFKDKGDENLILHREEMDIEQLNKARAVSRAKEGPAWSTFADEMYRKVVVRRGSKSVPAIDDKLRTIIERDDDYVDFDQTPQRTINHNPLVEDERKQVTDNPGVQMDDAFNRFEEERVDQGQENQKSLDGKSAPSDEQSGDAGETSGAADGRSHRLSAEQFRTFAKTLAGMANTTNFDKAYSRFCQAFGEPEDGSKDRDLMNYIFQIQTERATGKILGDGLMDEIDVKIEQSFGGI